jgi:flavin reductase (DIM6/NTAB) family NADH-FMN oxidoreductase RutF
MKHPLESQAFETFSPSDGEVFRQLARRWAATVTVVTVAPRVIPDHHGAPSPDGFTATAFLAVSIAPPIVLVSATMGTQALAMLNENDAFAVNLLSAEQRDLAEAFATPHETRGDLFARFSSTPDTHASPLLAGALGAFSARVRARIPAGDHTLVLGDVTALHLGAATEPLVYLNRRYGTMTAR